MNIGVLASHEGTTLHSLLDACSGGRIPGRVAEGDQVSPGRTQALTRMASW